MDKRTLTVIIEFIGDEDVVNIIINAVDNALFNSDVEAELEWSYEGEDAN